MRQKIKTILDHMVRKESPMGISSYKDAGEDTFELETAYTPYGHRTWLRYEPNNSMDMLRVEVRHVFGYIDVRVDPTTAASQLLTMLGRNAGSFQTTTAYLGIELVDGKYYALLNSFQHFVAKWSDEDIAEALSLLFFDMMAGLMVGDSSLTMLKELSE
jgi:hypothetical protein